MQSRGWPRRGAAADQAAFLKSHEQNLKKLVDARAECMKSCPMNMKMKAAGGTT